MVTKPIIDKAANDKANATLTVVLPEGESFEEILARAFAEYSEILAKCDQFAAELREKCMAAGGEEYVELTILAYRQAIAAHKLCTDKDGKPIFVS